MFVGLSYLTEIIKTKINIIKLLYLLGDVKLNVLISFFVTFAYAFVYFKFKFYNYF